MLPNCSLSLSTIPAYRILVGSLYVPSSSGVPSCTAVVAIHAAFCDICGALKVIFADTSRQDLAFNVNVVLLLANGR